MKAILTLLYIKPFAKGLMGKKMAGTVGFEPTDAGIKTPCLTTWRRPNINGLEETIGADSNDAFSKDQSLFRPFYGFLMLSFESI